MNKTFCKKSNLINFLLAGCLILFNLILVFTGCGLDTFYVIEPPSVYHETTYSNLDESENYFEFYTVEDDYDGVTFLGTEIYYKIYDSTSKLSSEYANINSAASNETTANQSASRLIETYKFQPLRSSDNPGANILIPNKGTGRKITVRLSNYHDYKAEFTVDGTQLGVPVRSIPKNPSFSFKELTSTPDLLPKAGDNADADYGYSTTTEEIKEYYVSLFAVSVAQDITYAWLYSNVVALGSVTISIE